MSKKVNRKSKKNRKLTLSLKGKGFFLVGLVVIFTIGIVAVNAANNRKSDVATNNFTVAHLEGRIEETFDSDVAPEMGKEVTKDVKVKNTGNTNLFVRVMVFPEVVSKTDVQLPANIKKEGVSGQIELLNRNNDEWIDGGDDYYYYTKKIEPEKSSPSLFTGVKLDGSLLKEEDNQQDQNEFHYYSYDGSKMTIMIKEETITTSGDTYQEAWNMKNENGQFKTDALAKVADALAKEKE